MRSVRGRPRYSKGPARKVSAKASVIAAARSRRLLSVGLRDFDGRSRRAARRQAAVDACGEQIGVDARQRQHRSVLVIWPPVCTARLSEFALALLQFGLGAHQGSRPVGTRRGADFAGSGSGSGRAWRSPVPVPGTTQQLSCGGGVEMRDPVTGFGSQLAGAGGRRLHPLFRRLRRPLVSPRETRRIEPSRRLACFAAALRLRVRPSAGPPVRSFASSRFLAYDARPRPAPGCRVVDGHGYRV